MNFDCKKVICSINHVPRKSKVIYTYLQSFFLCPCQFKVWLPFVLVRLKRALLPRSPAPSRLLLPAVWSLLPTIGVLLFFSRLLTSSASIPSSAAATLFFDIFFLAAAALRPSLVAFMVKLLPAVALLASASLVSFPARGRGTARRLK